MQKRLHYYSGLIITIFIAMHLANHLCGIAGNNVHIEVMHLFRLVYRNIIIETILLVAVIIQIFTGLKLFFKSRKHKCSFFEKIQINSGLYLSFFLIVHVGAVLSGRFVLHLDTNIYFGGAGLSTFPYCVFFIPYYLLAIIAFFGHIAAIHSMKMQKDLLGISPLKQSYLLLIIGLLVAFACLSGVSANFKGIAFPEEYKVLVK